MNTSTYKWLSISVFLAAFCGCVGDPSTDTPPETLTPNQTTSEPGAEMPSTTDADANEFSTTDSGLKYRVLRAGNGPTATAASTVKVHYRGWLPDPSNPEEGTEFDSSYARGEPISFPLNGVIPGWTEGMQLVAEGGQIELEVPPNLGYGAQGAGGVIPPNATLRFSIELLEVTAPPPPATVGPVDADAPEEFTETESGLKYRIRRKGMGAAPKSSDTVTVHYRGWLPDPADPSTGHEFDSSYARGESTSFPLNGVIPGWTEGLQLVKEGGMIELDIPSELAYGTRGAGADIPPNADLRFIVELLQVH